MTSLAKPTLRFVPHPWATITHLLLLGAMFALFAGRKPGMFRSDAILSAVPGFYSHVSNFSLSYTLYAGLGFLWLMMGVPMRTLTLAGVALAVANLAYEFFLPLLNTRDPMDAVYGVAGTLLAFAWLVLLRCYGLMEAPAAAE